MPTRIVPIDKRKRSIHVSLSPAAFAWIDRMSKHRRQTRTRVVERLIQMVRLIAREVCQ